MKRIIKKEASSITEAVNNSSSKYSDDTVEYGVVYDKKNKKTFKVVTSISDAVTNSSYKKK